MSYSLFNLLFCSRVCAVINKFFIFIDQQFSHLLITINNVTSRLENRQADLLGLYTPYLDDEEAVERRLAAEMPGEIMGHRIMVTCHQLKYVNRPTICHFKRG